MSKTAPFLSIIIPVYNAKNHITKCVRSFACSEFKDLEIVLIDDGSIDGSSEICDELSACDSRIAVYHCDNSGPGAARNYGIKHSAGEYIFFCDSDDYVSKADFEAVMREIERTKCDLYVFNRCNESAEIHEYFVDTIGMTVGYTESLEEIFKFTLFLRLSAPWKKVFKRSIIENNSAGFPTGRILYEDLSFFLKYLQHVENAEVLNQTMYYHRYKANSLSRKTQFSQFADIRSIYDEMRELSVAKNLDKRYLTHARNRLLAILMGVIVRMKKRGISDKEIISNIRKNDLDTVFRGMVPQGIKGMIRLLFYRSRQYWLYSMLYR